MNSLVSVRETSITGITILEKSNLLQFQDIAGGEGINPLIQICGSSTVW